MTIKKVAKVVLRKGKINDAYVVGYCELCEKEHAMGIGDIANGVAIIKAFDFKQQYKTVSDGTTVYTYA
jgi:hypothetical protein